MKHTLEILPEDYLAAWNAVHGPRDWYFDDATVELHEYGAHVAPSPSKKPGYSGNIPTAYAAVAACNRLFLKNDPRTYVLSEKV